MPASLVLPSDEGVREALARLGMVTVEVIGPGDLKARLGGELSGDGARMVAADVEALARLLGRG